jgi:nucleoid DNA-binding protein
MTKQELLKRVATTPGVAATLNKKDVGVLVDAVFSHIAEYFITARVSKRATPRFSYPGFGTFTKKRRGERSGRNPQTGEPIVIPETVTVSFQPGQELKAHLNREAPKRRRGA